MRVCVCFTIQKVVNSFFFDASGRVCLGKGVLNFVQTYSTVQGLVILSKWIERVWRKILSKFKVRLGWLLHAFFILCIVFNESIISYQANDFTSIIETIYILYVQIIWQGFLLFRKSLIICCGTLEQYQNDRSWWTF